MLDTLKTVRKFQRLYNIGTILATGYVEVPVLGLDYGPIFSTFGFNDVEGLRIRGGARTYFTQNDPWRLEGFGAYGFRDQKFKFGLSGKWLIDKRRRVIIAGGYRRDVEQIGASLTTSRDVLGRNLASSSIVNTSANDRLTSIEIYNASAEFEPFRNFVFRTDASFRTLESASSTFSLDYFTDATQTTTRSDLRQTELVFTGIWEPGKKSTGFGVERRTSNEWFPTLFASYTKGVQGPFDSDFDYDRLQVSLSKAFRLGGLGTFSASIEAGKTFDDVPLGLLSPVPGNQSFFSIFNTFSQLDFYEFVTDEYVSVHLEHNFGGRLFARIPALRKLNLREIIGFRTVWGNISQSNIDLSRPAFESLLFPGGEGIRPIRPEDIAPVNEPYFEYSFGVGNIFKVFRIDVNIRGNYNELPDARDFGVTGSFGFFSSKTVLKLLKGYLSLQKFLFMTPEKVTTFDVLIEIPKGSRNKYEYDFELKKIRYDRMIFSSMMYPADYGFVPETLALDGDPLDVLVLVTEPTFPGCVIEVKPIGVFHMADEKGPDEKVICVPVSDPIANRVNDLSEVNPHLVKEIEHFFQVYKDLEEKKVDVGGWGDVKEAKTIVAKCVERYRDSDVKRSNVTIY